MPGGVGLVPAPNNFLPYIGLRKSGGASATGDPRLDNALRAACYGAGAFVPNANAEQCNYNPNYRRCVRVTYRNGIALRQTPCRDANRAPIAAAATGLALCAADRVYASGCGEPYQYLYVTNGQQAGYALALDGETNTATVVPCIGSG
jgi:hypothetical protein